MSLADDHPLLHVVHTWCGRRFTQNTFSELGFSLHLRWQERITEFCGQHQVSILDRYWDEVARETMESLGQGNPNTREFSIQPKNRSIFLDELFAARALVEPPFKSPPLVKCLFEHYKKTYFDNEFRQAELVAFEKLQQEESARLGITAVGWTGRKKDAVPFVDAFGLRLNFQRQGNRWRKRNDNGLVFDIGVDTAGNPFCTKPPLIFRIFHANEPRYAFEIENLDVLARLVPGVGMYGRCAGPESYVLGIKGYIELFDVIASSLEKRAMNCASN